MRTAGEEPQRADYSSSSNYEYRSLAVQIVIRSNSRMTSLIFRPARLHTLL